VRTSHERVFIGGSWERPTGTARLDVVSPSTGEPVGSCPSASEADIDRAVMSARTAFDSGPWPHMSFEERRRILARAAALIDEQTGDLDQLITKENGSPVRMRQGMIGLGMLNFHLTIEEPPRVVRLGVNPDLAANITQEPMGVVGAIVPWNGPLVLAMSRVAPALLAGCTVVLKTATETPLDTLAFGQALADAGLPSGVFSVLSANKIVSEALVRHPAVDKIAFTGSTTAGRRIGGLCGEGLKRVSLELGGKSAAVLLDDVDLDAVLPRLLGSGLLNNNGEACMAQTRVIAPRALYEQVVSALADAASAARVGDPLDPSTEVGPLVSEQQRERVEGYIEVGRKEGAQVVSGGGRPPGLESGWYVEPTIFRDVDNHMRIAREEIFGPVVVVIPYDGGDDEAVRMANDSPYGLAAGIYSSDHVRGLKAAKSLRTGIVGVNASAVDPAFPFGGFKESGLGRQHGFESISAFLESKTVSLPANERQLFDEAVSSSS
jgi:aldehyde dehydrogenase (NAD+)